MSLFKARKLFRNLHESEMDFNLLIWWITRFIKKWQLWVEERKFGELRAFAIYILADFAYVWLFNRTWREFLRPFWLSSRGSNCLKFTNWSLNLSSFLSCMPFELCCCWWWCCCHCLRGETKIASCKSQAHSMKKPERFQAAWEFKDETSERK